MIERLLSLSPHILALGELHHLQRDLRNREICTCGKACDQCEVWKPIYQLYKADQGLTMDQLISEIKTKELTEILTDNSKTTACTFLRPWKLRRQNLFILHVVRDGEACLQSNLRYKRGPLMFSAAVTGIQFLIAHLSALFYRWYFGQENSQIIHYEDIASLQFDGLFALFHKLDLPTDDLRQTLSKPRFHTNAHQLSGNEMRRSPEIQIKTSAVQPAPVGAKIVFKLITWPVRLLLTQRKKVMQ